MTPKRPRGRPPKYPPEEVRQRLLSAARERLRVSGVESGLDSVTLDGAIVDADVPRGMSYKIWQDDVLTPQDAFRRATVLDLLSIPATAGLPATRELTEKLLAEHRDVIEGDDLDARRALFKQMTRAVGAFNYQSLAAGENWKLYTALRTAAATRADADPQIVEVLEAGERYLVDQYSLLYEEVRRAFGLTLRPGLSMPQFAAACYAVNEGLALRMTDHPARVGLQLPTGADGEVEEWTLFAVAFDALIEGFFTWD